MENIHGVDVSWLHRSTADLSKPPKQTLINESSRPRSPSSPLPPSKPISVPPKGNAQKEPENQSATELTPPTQPPPVSKSPTRRPGLLSRASSEKLSSSAPQTNESRPTLSKKSSWMSSLGAKFSTQSQKASQLSKTESSKLPDGIPATLKSQSKGAAVNGTPPVSTPLKNVKQAAEAAEEPESTPYVPQQPKSGPSFLSSALRRLSSNAGQTTLRTLSAGNISCERRVLNIDEGRERPKIQGLNEAKLRRVSFNVDVEIAGSSRYPAEEIPPEEDSLAKKTKKKVKKMKDKSEGEALKHPETVLKEKEEEGLIHASGEKLPNGMTSPPPKTDTPGPTLPNSPPTEAGKGISQTLIKVDEQDAGRENNAKPDSVPDRSQNGKENPTSSSKNDEGAPNPPPKVQERPTTDPVRIYRRCCQLREAPVLKRISEQLMNQDNCGREIPGVVDCLNLSRSRMQLHDIICLGDWLAVVPVKKLLLEDANLTDEGVRVILSGLLAAKPPEMNKRKRGRSSPTRVRGNSIQRSPGVIENLSLKNNKKLTAEAWKHISLFLHMSKSIKTVDLSMLQFPQATVTAEQDSTTDSNSEDPGKIFFQSLSNRLDGDNLEQLTLNECGLDTNQVSTLSEIAIKLRLSRVGVADNSLDENGLRSLSYYLKSGACKGLDLGGNDLRDRLSIISESLDDRNPLWALSLANCNLNPSSLEMLFPALAKLSDFRFLDLSHNRDLFSSEPTALNLIRRYIPKLRLLKRLHLIDVSLSLPDAIGIAEILPETRNLCHFSILENSKLTDVVKSPDSDSQEEACALYASLMTAVRLSKTLMCIDLEAPGEETSEVVKALARQQVAYCLKNIERYTDADALRVADAAAALPDIPECNRGLLDQIIGKQGDDVDDEETPAPPRQEDILVGGSGWAKALSHCLNQSDLRRISIAGRPSTPQTAQSEASKAHAKEMGKTLLRNARSFRERLQTVMAQERGGESSHDVILRLQYVDRTLASIIRRFEEEYPECRKGSLTPIPAASDPIAGTREITESGSTRSRGSSPSYSVGSKEDNHAEQDGDTLVLTDRTIQTSPSPSRRGSQTEMAYHKQALEEGSMLRMGQAFRREVLPPTGQNDYLHGTSAQDPKEPEYAVALRTLLNELGGEEIRARVLKVGWKQTVEELKDDKARLMELESKGLDLDKVGQLLMSTDMEG